MVESARPFLYPVIAAFVGAAFVSQPSGEPLSPPLAAKTTAGWSQYAAATGQRIDRELADLKFFLASDFTPNAANHRQAVLRGELPVTQMSSRSNGRAIDVPGAWVHHWRGAVLLRGARLDGVFRQLQEQVPGTGKGDVVASQIRSREGATMRVYIKIQRSKLRFTFVYNTEHLVTFNRRDATRGSSRSVATKIAELNRPGTPAERELAPGSDNGFLWRWNSYWRYQEVAEGVIAECESISLSREVGFPLATVGGMLANSAARESMESALTNLRTAFAAPARAQAGLTPAMNIAPTGGRTPRAWSSVR